MCKISFDEELGKTDVKIYHNLASLPDHKGCGIVKVEINLLEVVKEDDFGYNITKEKKDD